MKVGGGFARGDGEKSWRMVQVIKGENGFSVWSGGNKKERERNGGFQLPLVNVCGHYPETQKRAFFELGARKGRLFRCLH